VSDVRNDGPVAAANPATTGPAKTNAAKKTTAAKKANPAKKTAGPAATKAEPTVGATVDAAASSDRAIVVEMLTNPNPEFAAKLSTEMLALLATVRLEQRRSSLFDADGLYVGPVSFTTLVKGLLGDVQEGPIPESVLNRMRRNRVYTSVRTGSTRAIMFHGSELARDIVKEVTGFLGAQTKPSGAPNVLAPGFTAGTPTLPPEPSTRSQAVADMLTECVVEDVLRKIRHDRDLLDQVIASLNHHRFTL
jgi:hypothetical protein